jgi:hypothetical protein
MRMSRGGIRERGTGHHTKRVSLGVKIVLEVDTGGMS